MTTTDENKLILKKSFKVTGKIENVYTGGKVLVTPAEDKVVSVCGQDLKVFDLATGAVLHTLPGDTEAVTSMAIHPNGAQVVNGSRSMQLRLWDLETGKEIRSFKAHAGPVVTLAYDPTGSFFASGSSDSTVRVWDVEKGFCTHNFKGHKGVVSCVKFHSKPNEWTLFTASEDTHIRMWDLISKTCVAVFESHVSVVTSLELSNDYQELFSAGRDRVVNVWNLKSKKLEKTIPVYETIETIHVLPPDFKFPGKVSGNKKIQYFTTAGDKGALKIWSGESGQCVYQQTLEEHASQSLVTSIFLKSHRWIGAVNTDRAILFYDLETFERKKQIVGTNDEIIDLKFLGEQDTHIAVASSSETVRVYDLATLDCSVFFGHSDIIICMDTSKDGAVLVTGSKDRQARVWKFDPSQPNLLTCVGVCSGHTEPIGGICLSKKSNSFLITGSEDKTVKLWDLSPLFATKKGATAQPQPPVARFTKKAHDKDINSIAVAPNDKLFATGSQDKTAKIWEVADGKLLGTLRGHKRGIWSVVFSPVDQVVATSSGDKTLKIWSLSDYSCLRTFEGHTNSVLKVGFLTAGMQLISSASDGLIKLWTIKTSDCVNTFDAHEDKIWALSTTKKEDRFVSGGGDSIINIWEDKTQQEEEEEFNKEQENILKEQELSNYLYQKDYKNAILLCFELEQPRRLYNILSDIVENQSNGDKDSITGSKDIDDIIRGFDESLIERLLGYAKDWNTNGRFTRVAQNVLNLVLTSFSNTKLLSSKSFKQTLEALVPYTERHFIRINQLMTNSFIVDFTLDSMDLLGTIGADETIPLNTQPDYIPVARKITNAEETKGTEKDDEGEGETTAMDQTNGSAEEVAQEEPEAEDAEEEEEKSLKKGGKKKKKGSKSEEIPVEPEKPGKKQKRKSHPQEDEEGPQETEGSKAKKQKKTPSKRK